MMALWPKSWGSKDGFATKKSPKHPIRRRRSFRPRAEWLEDRTLPDGTSLADSFRLTGDFSGDGRTDIVFIGRDWDAESAGPGLAIREFLSIGNGT
jgi:hypothetical protein